MRELNNNELMEIDGGFCLLPIKLVAIGIGACIIGGLFRPFC